MLNSSYMVHTIDNIHYKSDQTGLKGTAMQALENKVEEEREVVRQQEYRVIRKIKHVPEHLIKENEKKTAGYLKIPTVKQE
jgi:hypothetical protein